MEGENLLSNTASAYLAIVGLKTRYQAVSF